ncbi:MAG: two-component system, cell cycle sensor histidine kinase and response regulator CckA, partial [Sphingomonadales bacterium]|nr:two-component system, cell cycle sensor histidine kinase and response regulator CckA [Sphingomonadales bacterium]
MLYQELPRIDSTPLDGWGRWFVSALIAAAAVTAAVVLLLVGHPMLGGLAVSAGAVAAAFTLRGSGVLAVPAEALAGGPDYSLVGSALGLSRDPVALTDGEGGLLVVNTPYRERFGSVAPMKLAAGEEARQGLKLARSMAWRDGAGCVAGIETSAGSSPVEVERVGARSDLLLWRFPEAPPPDALSSAVRRVEGVTGERLASAGMLAAVVDATGVVLAANGLFAERALGPDHRLQKTRFADLVEIGEDEQMRLVAEGETGQPVRAVHVPADLAGDGGAGTFLLFDAAGAGSHAQSSNLQALLDVLPIGLALVDRDGRFLTMNGAFRQAAGLKGSAMPAYPGDLLVKEDKAAVADAIRRNARGPAMSGDLAVRLAHLASEPVALTIAGLRGLGDAAVLLLLKDNSEEAKLKRQVAQATKMQVVGQLAGGVAHDFNNILTAIIGHCDLMLMRHTPGDSDYDDIQQIKSNSNRAAGLTRQLLAFSRQQTLRPQVLQLPDVVSEVSHLLKRLLGETVELVVKHGRSLGPIRADPGQLEQVIINLAVNARDAMVAKGGGTLTIQTYSVKSDQVAELGSDILPIADYSALSVTDTGTGIPPSVLGKIFEPFFTTKEVGKGTGLGLSTVYGIVKQSGGFIFADSKVGDGTRFVIYLPVHREDAKAGRSRKPDKAKKDELWG